MVNFGDQGWTHRWTWTWTWRSQILELCYFCMHCFSGVLDNIFTCATYCQALLLWRLNSLCFIRFEFACKSILSSMCTETGWLFLLIVGCTTNRAYCILCSFRRLHLVWCFTGIPQSFSSNLEEQSHGHQ